MNDSEKKQRPRYAERVLERGIYGQVVRSELVPIEEAGDDCQNPCGHIGVISEGGWLYDFVKCAICGRSLGVS